ncbi:baseplate J/gp47 family protein [Catenuloplanes atrovinosus]|uniref:Baseplate assembly protein n=1 Tax=Catenuloplanes atrovinosus TaxID=137266 RepID=A0AAE3YM19_9ACTN|nr:baseplate J/gp47 family protein [Catenuloplanes atrovinosus]MDR7275497.1 hypothetical protein [Catenuloplanes atrovinosus]
MSDQRRAAVRKDRLNGIDGVEVGDDPRELTVTFLGKAPRRLGPENIRIDGGRRVTGIRAVEVEIRREQDPDLDDHLLVRVDRSGDTSTYTLSIVEAGDAATVPYRDFDQRYASATFTFCPSGTDCKPEAAPPRRATGSPVIDYTTRDYASLRRHLLDRMTLTVPHWRERHEPDLGVTLVELLAYAGDRIGYHQDAVAAEAYLDTARQRTSVRRHVRLIDYPMHDGCNARAWVTLRVDRPVRLEPGRHRFAAVDVSRVPAPDRPEVPAVLTDTQLGDLPAAATVEVFEPVTAAPVTLRPAHNTIRFWTWGETSACLPIGATSATLRDEWQNHNHSPGYEERAHASARRRALRLSPGDVLIIEERIGPGSGAPADADPAHRQAVRLLSVTEDLDRLHDQPLLEVTWSPEDALTFPVTLAGPGGPHCEPLRDITVARANVVLVDHGRDLGFCGGEAEETTVPPGSVTRPDCGCGDSCGCPDRPEPGPAASAIDRLMESAAAGTPLTPEDVAELSALLGEPAVLRAGVDAALPAADQAAALETLLAQVTYPGVTRPFRPRLRRAPVTFRAPYPDAENVSAAQAHLLAAVPARVRAWLEQLWRRVREGDRLRPRDLAALELIFGPDALESCGLGHRPERALRELLARFDRLLAGKLRRLAALRARADNGEVLTSDYAWEIAQSWGPRYAGGLHPGDPRLAGPARGALVQDPARALPALTVTGPGGLTWTPRRDLLSEGPRGLGVVGEQQDDGTLVLRFGDGRHGRPPAPGSTLSVRYRVGSGIAGNVGAEAISHLVICDRSPGSYDECVAPPPTGYPGGGPGPGGYPGGTPRPGGYPGGNPGPGGYPGGSADPGGYPDPAGQGGYPDRPGSGGEYGDDPRPGGHPGRPAQGDYADDPRPGDYRDRPGDYRDRPGDYRDRPGDYRDRPGDHDEDPQDHYGEDDDRYPDDDRYGRGDHHEDDEPEPGGPEGVTAVRNPLPAAGGTDPEPVEQVRQLAPLALRRRRLRAVTADDYAELAGAVPGVQRAAAQLRWTGSGRQVHVAVDPLGTAAAGPALLDAVRAHLERFRRIGHDLAVVPAARVPLDVALTVCVTPGHHGDDVRDDVRRAVRALFAPDAVTFAEPVRASRIIAAAAAVEGVTSVRLTRLRRQFRPEAGELEDGVLLIGPLEVAQLDDDPSVPEQGRLTVTLGGGR